MAGIAIPYHFQSVNTKFIAISMKEDKVGQKVVAKRFIPEDASVLFTNRPIGPEPSVVEITGASGLYVSLNPKEDAYPLIWSDKKCLWVVNQIKENGFVILPADGKDLFWVNKFNDIGVAFDIFAIPRKDVKPPQNEWSIIPAE